MSNFRREDRYIVIKCSDMDKAPSDLRRSFLGQCRRLHDAMLTNGAPARSFLVIEKDWPEYEAAWQMIERRMTGAAPVVERQPVAEWCDPLQLKAVIQGVVARERMRPASLPDSEVAEAVYAAITEHLPIYEDVYDQLSEMIEPHVKRPYRLDAPLPASVVDSMGFLLKAYTAPPDLAELRATIARLTAEIEDWKQGSKAEADAGDEARAEVASLKAEIERLKGGQGEPVAWANDQQLLLCSKSPREDQPNNPLMHNLPRNIAGSALKTDYCNTPLYTSPPAPVSVVTPQHQPAPADSGTHPHNDGLDSYREPKP